MPKELLNTYGNSHSQSLFQLYLTVLVKWGSGLSDSVTDRRKGRIKNLNQTQFCESHSLLRFWCLYRRK